MGMFRIDSPRRLTAVYLVFGTVWVLGSDMLVTWLGLGLETQWLFSAGKGLLFVALTAALLHLLSTRMVRRHAALDEEMVEHQRRWQFTLESTGIGTWEWNGVTNEVKYSREWKAMLGYADEEVGRGMEEWVKRLHPEDSERARRELQRHIQGETTAYECEFRMRARDGSYRWILSRGLIVSYQADGQPCLAFGTHTDITARKHAEAAMADALALARAVLRSSPLGIIACDPEGNTVLASESAAVIIGTDVPTLLRQNFRELESRGGNGLRDAAEKAMASGVETNFDGELSTCFGRSLWVKAQFVPFDYRDGRHLLLLFSNETANHRASDELHLLHAAVRAAPSAWFITDAEGVIEWVNPAFTQITGFAAAEAIGQTPRLLRSGRHDPGFYRAFWETIRRGDVWSGEICNRRKDGSLYDEHMTVAPVRDAQGVVRHFVAIKQDVSERKRLEQQVTRTQRLESIGLLASGIAHDLNNVLTPILLSTELLRTRYPAAEATKFLDTVETAAQRGAGIVRQVLTFARGMDGGERAAVQPRYLLKDLIHLIEETFPRNIEITHDIPRAVNAVIGDLTQLHQVMLNLAVNARDAMPQGGHLTLAARNCTVTAGSAAAAQLKPGEYVALVVTDTGTGISPEVLDHMFEPFYTTKPRGKGTGLGLSTVYGIVRSHGGMIDVQTRLGHGSTFEVWLPAAPVERAPEKPAGIAATLRGEGRRVLVIDDEESIRTVAQTVLRRHGFVPVLAVDGTDGLRAVLSSPQSYAVVIVDMVMPRMSGLDLVRNLRLVAPDLPVIVSTGAIPTGGPDAVPDGELEKLRVRTFLPKPYDAERLLAALARELERTPAKVV